MRLHHTQIAMPPGQEDEARRFYADALGLTEIPKPDALAGRGGCWFRHPDAGGVELHLGVEDLFRPAAKAHPGLLVDDVDALEAVGTRIMQAGYDVSWVERHTFPGFERFHCRDAFGNRVEVMAPAT